MYSFVKIISKIVEVDNSYGLFLDFYILAYHALLKFIFCDRDL